MQKKKKKKWCTKFEQNCKEICRDCDCYLEYKRVIKNKYFMFYCLKFLQCLNIGKRMLKSLSCC